MADDPVPKHLRDFIARYIDSVAQLEALLLLHGNPAERWGIDPVAKRLYIAPGEALEILERLARDGLLTGENGVFHFHCATPELHQAADELAETYRRQLIPVTKLIHAKPRRIRAFADAFKFTKDT
jgi:hypothetical protein